MANSLSPAAEPSSQFARQYDIETIGGDQRQRLAEMLRSNMLNQPQGQMVSGWYVAPSWTQHLANMAQSAVGIMGGAALEKEKAQKTSEALKRFGGVEEKSVGTDGVEQTKTRPLTQDEQDMALMNLASVNPQIAGVYGGLLSARATRAQKLEDAIALEKLRQEGRLDNLRMAAMLRPAPAEKMITAMDENGNPYTVPQSQFTPGSVIYSPAAAKAMKEGNAAKEAKTAVSGQIQELRDEYGTLNRNSGITSEQNKVGTNLGAWASSTAPGQFLGRILGTENSTARDTIRMSRPALMQSIVKASGMSAKQIDSNAELKLMLDQATDPQAGYEANMKALKNLENRFVGGSAPAAPSPSLPSANDIDAEIARRQGKK